MSIEPQDTQNKLPESTKEQLVSFKNELDSMMEKIAMDDPEKNELSSLMNDVEALLSKQDNEISEQELGKIEKRIEKHRLSFKDEFDSLRSQILNGNKGKEMPKKFTETQVKQLANEGRKVSGNAVKSKLDTISSKIPFLARLLQKAKN
ncbi:MAG: hypothetical protein V3575_02060 [Candidatus Absconditabacteria bacterium]